MRSAGRAATAALLAGVLALLAYTRAGAAASTVERMDLDELVERAELVFEARVAESRSFIHHESHRVETEYVFDVARTWKGDDEAVRVVRMPGGVLPDGSALLIPGLPRFVEGERAIVFLSRTGSTGIRMPIGLGQGKLSIVAAARGRVAVQDAGGAGFGEGHEADGVRAYGYADLVARLEALCAADRAKRTAEAR